MGREARSRLWAAGLLGALALATLSAAAGAVERIQVLALFKDKAMVEIDGRQRLLVPGEPSPEGVVLVSSNAREAVLEVDGRRATYTLGTRISNRYAEPERQVTSLSLWPDAAGMYYVTGSINGFPVRFLVDTGATVVAMNSDQARRLGIDYEVEGRRARTVTASGEVESFTVTLDRVRVGDIVLSDVPATVLEGAFPRQVLLGMSFLGRLEINRSGRLMELHLQR
jgi:aspartyl protease family protein